MLRAGIRMAAIALIVFPEPVTTALGILILCAVAAAPKQDDSHRFGDMESLVRKSIKVHEEPVGFRRYFGAEKEVVYHTRKIEQPSNHLNAADKSEPATLQTDSSFNNRKVSKTVLHHTLKTSFPQYEMVFEDLSENIAQPTPVGHHKLKNRST
jgi:hypothetical protein